MFRVFGIDVLLHWSWFLVALIQVRFTELFNGVYWHVATYLALFGIVLLHEFGHALACRSVGGQADTIVLWPLGGIAFVRPPARPGAVLWSIAAGPLVNVLLVPITLLAYYAVSYGAADGISFSQMSDVQRMMLAIFMINLGILFFNMLPVYPLDGGQILQSLLWFVMGRAKSLRVVTVIGLSAALVGGVIALSFGHLWLVLMAAFIGWQSWVGYRASAQMLLIERQWGG